MAHQVSAVLNPCVSLLAEYAVIESAASGTARSITGNRHAAVATSSPAIHADDPRKASPSLARLCPRPTIRAPESARANPSHAAGRAANALASWGKTSTVAA